jgi:hypothetical protein
VDQRFFDPIMAAGERCGGKPAPAITPHRKCAKAYKIVR